MTHESSRVWNQRGDRRRVELRGFALGDGIDADIDVWNLSYDGCRIRSAQPLKVGDELDLRIIGRGGVKGVVRWVAEDRAGIRFIGQD